MSKNDGGPAFPETKYGGNSDRHPVDEVPGMTLRDWFAGQALAGMLRDTTNDITLSRTQSFAITAYEVADAMIAERSK
jgi:hypothetical protein